MLAKKYRSNTMPTPQERISGGLIGLLVGDALGVPYEFHPPQAIPPFAQIEFDPPANFRRSYPDILPGTWSDDGAQALCLLASVLTCRCLDPEDLGFRLLSWYEHGLFAVDNRVFDVGIQTSKALNALRSGVPADRAGPAEERSQGNGSLMRVLPLALWHRGSDEALVRDARMQSRVTHGHVRVQLCCALYCLWARRIMQQVEAPWADAVATLRRLCAEEIEAIAELDGFIRPDEPPKGTGTGYAVDCLHSARWAVEQGDYEQVVKAAIALGEDTDTTACVAGGIAGLRDGIGAIPDRWRHNLRGQELVEPLLERLMYVSAAPMRMGNW
jgi:ADP-ribosyl-[dinitrogen reductase] hydrolase